MIKKLKWSMLRVTKDTDCGYFIMKALQAKTTFPLGGYHRKLLRVDLTQGMSRSEDIPADILRSYIGGTGLGVYLLYSEVLPRTAPFASENKLIFATGPLTGTLVPGSGTYTVLSKSPLTGFAAAAQANGYLGARLKAAGYDAVVVEGCSPEPVYLHIHQENVALLPADFLKAKGVFESERVLRARHGEKGFERRISIAAIGPAGEHSVRFAGICSDRGHMVASGGLGAVMGSKNLKALVVEGDGPVPLHPERVDDFKAAVLTWRDEARATGLGKTVHEKGTQGLFRAYHDKGWVPVKNLTTNRLPDEALRQLDWAYIRNEIYEKVPRACQACTFNHCHTVRVRKGRYKGFVGEEPEYEIFAGFGSNWGIHDPGAITMLNHLNDDLGMDAKEVSFLISMLMEGFEKGEISADELDGIELTWGNTDAVEKILKKISHRDGIGNLLADGVMRAATALGDEFDNMAVYVKQGNAPHIHDSRTRWGTLFTQAISNTGSQEGMDMTSRANPELGFSEPTRDPDEYVAYVQSKTGPKRQFEECLVFCYFQACSLKNMVHTLNVLTGWDLSIEDCLVVGERVINLLRMYSIREGLTMEDDRYSHRLGESPVDGSGKGKSMNPTFDQVRATYYQTMGWDENGVPTPETLKRLDLTFTLV
jgi:aldehyde:ferredoxin oxidoreductase